MHDKLYKMFEDTINMEAINKLTKEDINKLDKIFNHPVYKSLDHKNDFTDW